MDIEAIQKYFIKENQLLGLGFPGQGYVFMRVEGVEVIGYEYGESPGAIAADTQEDSARLPMATYSIDNLLKVTDCNHVYQMFMGWKPGAVRRYTYYPYETARGNLDVKRIFTKSPFGYTEGHQSPYDTPSPVTEMFIPKGVEVAFAWHNPLNTAVTVEQNIMIRRLQISIIRDAELIERILKGNQPCRLVTLGGIGDSFGYEARTFLDIDHIKLSSTRAEIEQAVKARGA